MYGASNPSGLSDPDEPRQPLIPWLRNSPIRAIWL